jgi:hypothetical protein
MPVLADGAGEQDSQGSEAESRGTGVGTPDRSPRQIAWLFTDQKGYVISESSAYCILKSFDLVENPAFRVMSATHEFKHPAHRVHELWQTDFTYFKIQK